MLLTPEALAALNWSADGATHDGRRYHEIGEDRGACRTVCDTLSRADSITDEEDAAYSALLAASPALAAACLKAYEYADIMERGEQIRMAETVRLRNAIRAALEAAGVEVGDA